MWIASSPPLDFQKYFISPHLLVFMPHIFHHYYFIPSPGIHATSSYTLFIPSLPWSMAEGIIVALA